MAVSDGIATFSNLSLNKTGTGYTFQASSSGSLGGATSATFNIMPGLATHLAFSQQPGNPVVGAAIAPAVTVQILDANNNLVSTDNSDSVTLKLASNPTGATLGGSTTATVSGGVATFSTLSVNLVGTGYTLGASSGSLTGATSTSFSVASAATSTLIEGFENGLSNYVAAGGQAYAATAAYAAHDGSEGLDMADSSGWALRTDPAAQVKQGQTLSVWLQLAGAADGRAYFGFGASSHGTLSLVAAPDTGQLMLQDNNGFGYTTLAAVHQSYQANHWYRLQVIWGTTGSITGQLYDSDGQTLLNTVKATDTRVSSGGIAFRATFDDKYFDTVTVVNNAGGSTVRATGSTSPASASNPAAPLPAVVDRLFASTGQFFAQSAGFGSASQFAWSGLGQSPIEALLHAARANGGALSAAKKSRALARRHRVRGFGVPRPRTRPASPAMLDSAAGWQPD